MGRRMRCAGDRAVHTSCVALVTVDAAALAYGGLAMLFNHTRAHRLVRHARGCGDMPA